MFDAARNNNGALLLAAIDAGLPANLTNAQGNTLLMLAAYSGHVNLVEELIARGGDVDALNDNLQSPIAGAVFKDYDDVVHVLAQAGADPRKGKPTAIETAYMFNRKQLLETLGATSDDISDNVPKPLSSYEAGSSGTEK
ncbi:ankyrin [Thelephora ganbajun]|uniref:Ankyrin n=1 Tax=Thelephora ganbajun TaxID=370292 RepID=A0ACB6ZW20_THEGA|nr:ankyrin [Thelephora ganbajun]